MNFIKFIVLTDLSSSNKMDYPTQLKLFLYIFHKILQENKIIF